jgi:nucleoside-diphosphate-sugar epimerase
MPPKLFVAGGSGFIGSAVCQCADALGYEVVSLSRRGQPDLSAAWVERVQWISASVFDTQHWQHHLPGCAAIVYCIGIILERPGEQATYQRINTEAAISLADGAVAARVGAFVHVSVSRKPPFIPPAYLASKRNAEERLRSYPFRTVILRPGAVYGPRRAWSYILKTIFDGLALLPSRQADFPLAVWEVARASLAAAADPAISGVLDVPTIRKLSGGPRARFVKL